MPVPVLHHYIIVRADLTHPAQAVYIAHAAGESNPANLRGLHVVILVVPTAAALLELSDKLSQAKVQHLLQRADDGDPMTIGIEPDRKEKLRKHLSWLPLLR